MLKNLTALALASMLGAAAAAAAATPQFTLRVALPRTPGAPIAPSTPVQSPSTAQPWTLTAAPVTAFNSATVGSSSQLTVDLKNTGTATSSLDTPVFTGIDASQFAVHSSTCSSVVVQSTCRVQLRFSPSSAGPKSATLSLGGQVLQYSGTGVSAPEPNSAMLLHFNGSFEDVHGNAIANIGGTTLSSASKYGSGTASFNGSNQGLMFSKDVFDFGAADYTVEAWVRPRAGNNNLQSLISNSWGWQLYWGNAGLSLYISSTATGSGYYSGMPMTAPSGSVPAGAWSHIAVVRYAGTLSLYVNGTRAATTPFTVAQVKPEYPASLGTIYTTPTATSYFYGGEIDEFRVTKNVARYTGNFTPAAQEFTQ